MTAAKQTGTQFTHFFLCTHWAHTVVLNRNYNEQNYALEKHETEKCNRK